MVGSALVRAFKKKKSFILIKKSKKELDLTNQRKVRNFFLNEKPDQVYLAAAKVGGIKANNNYPAEFIYQNSLIEANIINSAFISGVKKLLFFGSSCIYPKFNSQPINEEDLLSGYLEPTNEPYAIAKILGVKICESYNRQYGGTHKIDYRSIMPTNLYGPGDNYDLENSHVIPALIRKFHEAKIKNKKEVIVWGTGTPKREFLHVDDLASAAIYVMNIKKNVYKKKIRSNHINIGFGSDLTIKELSEVLKEITNFQGHIRFNKNKYDGMPRKLLNSKKIFELGWRPKIKLKEGLRKVYEEYKASM